MIQQELHVSTGRACGRLFEAPARVQRHRGLSAEAAEAQPTKASQAAARATARSDRPLWKVPGGSAEPRSLTLLDILDICLVDLG